MTRVLVVKMSSLGDLFHALPAVHLVRRHLGAEIDWVVHDLYAESARCFTGVDRVIPFPRSSFMKNRKAFLAALREREYDLALDLQGLLKSAWVARRARAARRIGPSFSREGAHWLYDAVSGPVNKERHAVEECLDTVRYLGLPVDEVVFPVAFPVVEVAAARPRVAMLPCSRRPEKNWPVARFVETARALREQAGASILVVGGPADRAACAELTQGAGPGAEDWCGRTTIPQLGGLLASVDLLVTVDSGPMHMAAALGTPTVAVFGPTFPLRTGPYGAGHRVIHGSADLAQQPAAPVIEAALASLRGGRAP